MTELANANHNGPFPELRDALTRKGTWFWLLGFCAVLIVACRWPFVWMFSLYCCITPAPLFCYGVVRSGAIHRAGMMKIFITLLTLHCVLLAATLYLWRKFPTSTTGNSFGLGFIAIEAAAIPLLIWFTREKPISAPR